MIRRPVFTPLRLPPCCALTAALLCAAFPAAAGEKADRVRLGAFGSSNELHETHGDWTLDCRVDSMVKICTLLQSLADRNTQKPLLRLELSPLDAGHLHAVMTLPFDVDIPKGVQLIVDDRETGAQLPVKGCDSSGCHVVTVLEGETLARLTGGTRLSLRHVSRETGGALVYPASLTGFAAALGRATELAR